MNLVSILPVAPTGADAAPAVRGDAPGGFLAALAAELAGGGSADEGATTDAAPVEAAPEPALLATLAALVSRQVTAGLTVDDATSAAVPVLDDASETGTADTVEVAAEPTTNSRGTATEPAVDLPTSEVDGADLPATATVPRAADVPASDLPPTGSRAVTSDASSPAGPVAVEPGTPASTPAPAEEDGRAPATGTPTRATDGAARDGRAVPTVAPTETEGDTTGATDTPRSHAPAAAASERGPLRADAATPRSPGESTVLRTEGVTAPTTDAQPADAARGPRDLPSTAAQRVLDIVTRLEEAPPPRVVVIESGELRVRVGLDAGIVRMTVLGEATEAGDDLLHEAAAALEAQGYGTELDRSSSGGEEPPQHDDRDATPHGADTATTTTERPGRARAGLQL
jgi:hypothetical protein